MTTACRALFAFARRVSNALPPGRNSRSSRPTQCRHVGPAVSMIEEITGAAAPVTGPVVQRLDDHQVRCAAGLLRQAFTLVRSKARRDPMGPVRTFNRRIPASAEPQRLALRGARHVLGFVGDQPFRQCPGLEQTHRFRYAGRVGLNGVLQAFDLPHTPVLCGPGIKPSNPPHHVDAAHVVLRRERASAALAIRSARVPRSFRAIAADYATFTSFCKLRRLSGRGCPGNSDGHDATDTSPT